MTANISAYVATIEAASRGEEVRDSIVSALNAINNAIDSTVPVAVENAISELISIADNVEY